MTRLNDIIGKSLAGTGMVVAAAFGLAAPASAQTTAYATGYASPYNSPNSITVSIPVRASIGGSCTFATGGAPNGTYAIPGFIDVNSWTNDFTMTLQCTGPSRMAILSTNGGLLNSATAPATGYINLAPYTVAVSIAQNAGMPITSSCPAANLKATSGAACTLRGTAAPTVGLSFQPSGSALVNQSYVRVSAPAYSGSNILVSSAANGYADTLVITVSPAS